MAPQMVTLFKSSVVLLRGPLVYLASERMETITKNKVKLIKWLQGDTYILQHVQSEKLITTDEYTTLKSISEPAKLVTDLLDLIIKKGDGVSIEFLNMLKEDDVNESSPQLRQWIKTVNTSASKADPQTSVQSQAGASVNISASGGGNVCAPVISGSQISGFNMTIGAQPGQDTNNLRITDNQDFLKRNRGKLSDKVKNVDRIVDDLNFSEGLAAKVRACPTEQEKMRKVLEYTNTRSAAKLLVDALYEHEPDVMKELTTA